MAKDAKGHGSEARGGAATDRDGYAAHQSMVRKVLASGDVHSAMAHAVTGYDRKQQERAASISRVVPWGQGLRGGYYNSNALGLYLDAVGRAVKDINGGASHADAINNNFNGALARHLHRSLGTGSTDVDTQRRAAFK